tara:strand:+ start:1204 stop:1614 length:411 start_codon:yes stop_codon:yes gene_type:complete
MIHYYQALLKRYNLVFMRFLIIFATIYSVVVFQSDWSTDSQLHNNSKKIMSYHHPSSLTNNSINHYSVIHFFQYAAISILKFLNVWHIVVISILWEVFELFTHYEWGRESWLNKFFDIIFNISGFYFGRFFLKKVI